MLAVVGVMGAKLGEIGLSVEGGLSSLVSCCLFALFQSSVKVPPCTVKCSGQQAGQGLFHSLLSVHVPPVMPDVGNADISGVDFPGYLIPSGREEGLGGLDHVFKDVRV